MNLKFTKMHGLGNDFIVIDAIHQNVNLSPHQVARLSQRNTGIGFDQCLIIESSTEPDIDFFYRIFNADGQEVGQCGNGARCLARFLKYYKLSDQHTIRVATRTTRMTLQINADDTVTVDMGVPNFHPAIIPFSSPLQQATYSIPLNDYETISIHALSVGNPHAVIIVPNIELAPVHQVVQLISEHPLFPEQTNVGFMQIISPNIVRLRVYERGCGETNACGSGAVAAVAAGRLFHRLEAQTSVSLPGGELLISWPKLDESIYLTGPAEFIYEGTLIGE